MDSEARIDRITGNIGFARRQAIYKNPPLIYGTGNITASD
jgi:hypothetical protein